MNTKTDTKSTFHGIIFALLGLGIIYFGIAYSQNENSFNSSYNTAIGEIVEINTGIERNNETSCSYSNGYSATFSYTVNGTTYTIKEKSFSRKVKPNLGDTAKIYYDPANPSFAKFDLPTKGGLVFISMGLLLLFVGLSKALKNISQRASTFFNGSFLVVCGFLFPFALGSWKLFFLCFFLGILGVSEIIDSFTAPKIPVRQTPKITVKEFVELKKIEKVRDDFKNSNSINAKMRLAYGLCLILLGMFLMIVLSKPVNSKFFIYGINSFVAFMLLVGILYTSFIYKRFKDNKIDVILSLIGFIILSISLILLAEHVSFNKNCDTTTATVTQKIEGTDPSYYYKIKYEYKVNNITYQGDETYKTSNTPNIDDKLTIYYDSSNPDKAKLNLKLSTILFMTIWAGASIYLIGPIYSLKLIDEHLNNHMEDSHESR